MKRVLVTYKVKADRVQENEELVRAVYEELHHSNDPDVHYATFIPLSIIMFRMTELRHKWL